MGLFGINWTANSDGDWAPDWMDLTPKKKNGAAKTIASVPIEVLGKVGQGVGGLLGEGLLGKAFTGLGNAADEWGDRIRDDGIVKGTGGLIEDAADQFADNLNDVFAPEEEEPDEVPATTAQTTQTEVNLSGGRRQGESKRMGVTSQLAPWMLPTTTSRGFFGRFRR